MLDGLVADGDVYTAWFSRRGVRLRALEPRQGAPAGHRSRSATSTIDWIRGHAARRALAVADRRPGRGRGGDRRRGGERCAPRCPSSPTIRTCCFSTEVALDAHGAGRPAAAGRGRSSTRCSPPPTGLDLVGIYAGGPVCRGFANSLGQRNWHATTSFNLDWSLYHRADKAVKSALRGLRLGRRSVRRAGWRAARERLALLGRPPKTLAPGEYRAYLAPAALEEIVALLCWGGFSGRALATRQSPLSRMQGSDGTRLDPRVCIAENTADGVAPDFQAEGFARPARVAADRRGAARRLAGLAADGARVRARRQRRQRRRGAGVAGDGRRRRSRPPTRWPRSAPASASATSGTSTTPTGPPAG